ncbi:MAG: RsmD family RNA methyltransferase, partial [Sandaracinaceae bacterium]|nr:RsmD family RNA methyltransferase [Sandaracinaceae bacterium]
MRIVGGALSGRRLEAKAGSSTRPTSERVREAIASALEARGWIEGRHVLDLYAGTGA